MGKVINITLGAILIYSGISYFLGWNILAGIVNAITGTIGSYPTNYSDTNILPYLMLAVALLMWFFRPQAVAGKIGRGFVSVSSWVVGVIAVLSIVDDFNPTAQLTTLLNNWTGVMSGALILIGLLMCFLHTRQNVGPLQSKW